MIKIISNNIEIDIVKETFTIKKQNNALSTDFKLTHNTFPFLVVENRNSLIALGPRDITSINKKKIIEVWVQDDGELFYGELQILSY